MKKLLNNLFKNSLINIKIFAILLIVLGALVIVFAGFGVIAGASWFWAGFGLIWIAVAALLLWAVTAYNRLQTDKE